MSMLDTVILEGATNFRDLGGRRTAAGGAVRRGMVFRSDALHALTEDDRQLLRALGLRTAIDLRAEQEQAAEPTAAPFLRVLSVPLLGPESPSVAAAADGESFLRSLYEHLLVDAAGTIGAILLTIAHGDLGPLVFHCSAGKDRTGVVAAVLLLALEVDLECVLDDYERSADGVAEHRVAELSAKLEGAGLPPGLAAGMLGTPRHALADALLTVRHRFGSFEGYLVAAAGLGRVDLAALRSRLLA